MCVYGGDKCHDFWDKHLLYVLFIHNNYVQIYGGSTFSTASMGPDPVKLPGSNKLHSLDLAHLNPTQCKNTHPDSDFKVYSGFPGAYHEPLYSCTLYDSQGRTFTIKTTHQTILDYIDLHVSKKDQSHTLIPHHLLYPNTTIMRNNLYDQFIRQHFVHFSHQHIQ